MDRGRQAIWLIGIIVLVFSNLCWAQEDAKGCRDHPMFTRLPNYYLSEPGKRLRQGGIHG